MRKKYVSPKQLNEEVRRLNAITEYKYFTDLSEEDDNKIDQLTMDDFNSSQNQGEQPSAPENETPPTPEQNPFDNSAEGGEPKMVDEPPANEIGEPTEEIDVTDIVQSTNATKAQTDQIAAKVDRTLEKVNGLLEKIGGLEGSLAKMDQALTKIDSIYKELELMKPPSPEEAKEIMAQNSYPFNVTLDKYKAEGTPKNQTELEQGKNKLSLSNLLSDFNERDLRQSFNPPDPFQDKLSRSLPAYRI